MFYVLGLLTADHQCNTKNKKHSNDHQLHQIRSAGIETIKDVGSISTLTFDTDITVALVASENPMARTHRVLGRSLRNRVFECGGI